MRRSRIWARSESEHPEKDTNGDALGNIHNLSREFLHQVSYILEPGAG